MVFGTRATDTQLYEVILLLIANLRPLQVFEFIIELCKRFLPNNNKMTKLAVNRKSTKDHSVQSRLTKS